MHKIVFVLSLVILVFSSCRYRSGKHRSGNGHRATQQRNTTGFTGVETHGDIDIVVANGDFNVKIDAEQNLLQDIETNVENGRLVVRFRDGISLWDHGDATVYVTAPILNTIETHGSGDIRSEGRLADKNNIHLVVSGSGDIDLILDSPDIITATQGSGDITLKGTAKNIDSKTSGSGDLHMDGLKAENVKIVVHGSGDAEVFASESLKVEVSGSGDVHYKGSPKISTEVHGSGSVSKMD
jgi:Putative auto-transporter adhesin, head GIN domain